MCRHRVIVNLLLIIFYFFTVENVSCSYIRQIVPPMIIHNDYNLNKSSIRKYKNNVFMIAISGGIAGGVASAVTFPFDTLKIMRQTDVSLLSIFDGFNKLLAKELAVKSKFVLLDSIKKIMPLYSGFYASILGSIPSSAIYFGAYESTKIFLYEKFNSQSPIVHTIAAAFGNLLSSIVFVPKDAIKSQLQAYKTGSVRINIDTQNINMIQIIKNIYSTSGIKGFYPSYRATLLRNIPSAICRFVMYEEIKKMATKSSLKFMVAGAVASAFSSIISNPIDVIKTRINTGILPPGSPIFFSIANIYKNEGVRGLFSGLNARLISASIFGGTGFFVFEWMKKYFGVNTCFISEVEVKLENKNDQNIL